MEAKILCCSVSQTAKIYELIPSREDTEKLPQVQQKFILHLPECERCHNERAEAFLYDIYGEFHSTGNIKQKNINILLNKAIYEPDKLPSLSQPIAENRWSLPYCEYGSRKECYSNLYSLKLGRIETDPYIKMKTLKKEISIRRQSA